MTKLDRASRSAGEDHARCRWCRRVLLAKKGPGRPKQFCSQRCRQWDWVSRQRAADLSLGVDEIVISRAELDQLHDDLYVLACAVDDVERDLAGVRAKKTAPTARDLREALDWILAAAKPLRDREVSAPDVQPD